MDSRRAVYLAVAVACAVLLLLAWGVPSSWRPPTTCGFLTLTGFPCPFCGTTRGFFIAAQGDWAGAFRESPLGALLLPAAAAGLLVALGRLLTVRSTPPALPSARSARWYWIAAGLLVAANWIYRLSAGLR